MANSVRMPLHVFRILSGQTSVRHEVNVEVQPFASSYETKGALKKRASAINSALGVPRQKHAFISVISKPPRALPNMFFSAGLEHRVFDFIPGLAHIMIYQNEDVHGQSVIGGVGHLALAHDGKNAVITQLQGNVKGYDGRGVPEEIRGEYVRWQEALIESAKLYCKENNLTLWILHEKEYDTQIARASGVYVPAKYAPFRKKYALHNTPQIDPVYEKFRAFKIFEPPGASE